MTQTPNAPTTVANCQQCGEDGEGCEVNEGNGPYHACFGCQDEATEAEAAAEHEAREQAYRNTTATQYMAYWRAQGIDPAAY